MAKPLKTKIDVPEGEDQQVHAGDAGEPRVTKGAGGGADALAMDTPDGPGGIPGDTGDAHASKEKRPGRTRGDVTAPEPKKRKGGER